MEAGPTDVVGSGRTRTRDSGLEAHVNGGVSYESAQEKGENEISKRRKERPPAKGRRSGKIKEGENCRALRSGPAVEERAQRWNPRRTPWLSRGEEKDNGHTHIACGVPSECVCRRKSATVLRSQNHSSLRAELASSLLRFASLYV